MRVLIVGGGKVGQGLAELLLGSQRPVTIVEARAERADELRRDLGNVTIDAVVGRQVSQAIAVLQAKGAAGALGSTVLIHIGTNGTFTADQFDTIMRLAGGRRVVFVNIKAGRSWQDGNNSLLWSKVQQYPNASLIDWYSASVGHPEYFAGDGIHPSAAGIRAYGSLIAARLPR